MAIVEVSVVPVGTRSTSISRYVARCQSVLEGVPGIKYRLTPMGTVIEGDLDTVMDLVKEMHHVPFQEGAQRVYTVLKIDDRRDKEASMEQKMASVAGKLGQ